MLKTYKYDVGDMVAKGTDIKNIFIIRAMYRGYNNCLMYRGVNAFGSTVVAEQRKIKLAGELSREVFNSVCIEELKDER